MQNNYMYYTKDYTIVHNLPYYIYLRKKYMTYIQKKVIGLDNNDCSDESYI